jgi:hypothetical protein
MKTVSTIKEDLMVSAQKEMEKTIQDIDLTDRQKLALTCRTLFDKGHDSGIAGQITCRSTEPDTYLTQRFGLGFNKNLISRLINNPKKLLFPLLVMGPISLSIPALAFADYVNNDVTNTAHIQFNPSETGNVKVVNDYATFLSYGDNGYARLHESNNDLKQRLVDKYRVYSKDEKNVILNELRNSGGVHFHAGMQDRQGEYNWYEYSINIDPDLVSTSTSDSVDNALDNYLKTSVDQFYSTFRNYVEKKEGEGVGRRN